MEILNKLDQAGKLEEHVTTCQWYDPQNKKITAIAAKRQSSVKAEVDHSRPKVLAIVFWDGQGSLFFDFLRECNDSLFLPREYF